MQKEPAPQFYCPVCRAGITQNDIDSGAAIRRYHEVYCLEHFREKFPDECEGHPGTPVTAQCGQCGRWVCDDCLIDLAGEKVCAKCKPARIGEIITGQPAAQVVRKRWKPLTMGKNAIRQVGAKLFRKRYNVEPIDRGTLQEKRPSKDPYKTSRFAKNDEKEKQEITMSCIMIAIVGLIIILAIMSALGGC